MSDSNRGVLAALAAIAALLVATGVGAFYGSVYAPEKRHYQSVGPNGGQTYPSDSPRNGLADISGIDPIVESIIAKPQPRDTDEREQRDLAAQESMATFAYWMFWAVVLQTLLAGGALLALVKDLRQNRRSAEAQLRAYVSGRPDWVASFYEGSKPEIRSILKNHGETPAYQIRTRQKVFWVETPVTNQSIFPSIETDFGVASMLFPDAQSFVFQAVDQAATKDQIKAFQEGKITLGVVGEVSYIDTFGEPHNTLFASYLNASSDVRQKISTNYVAKDLEVTFVVAPQHNTAT